MSDTAIIDLRKQGLAHRVVAARLGISESTVRNCMRRNRLQGRFRATHPYGGTTRPITRQDSRRALRRGGYHDNDRELTPLQKLARQVDALYMRHVLREDTWPDTRDVERIIIRAVEEAEDA